MTQESNTFSIKNWSENDRPREKLVANGSAALSDAELIAILIGSGSRDMSAVELSRLILNHAGNSLDKLGRLSVKELMKFKGIGEAKAITITAAMELGKRRASELPTAKPVITCSDDAFKVLQPILGDLPHEEFWILYVNNSHKVLAKHQISRGGFTGTMVDTRIVFQKAVEEAAVAMILAHNHPSGKLMPSMDDKRLTQKLIEAGRIMDVKVLDHIIVTRDSFYSFADHNLL
ncbi:DNA repair protein RadC [Nonlabens mediterrranea]|uniref:DNA repair protein RadC n=1 Tax=Nonlabens mediterrranea TaxID=1419947 RepID=A0ABS0A6J1_9FLAO|nr:DNA repair protein RadC [Nonlabens mediterrranea]